MNLKFPWRRYFARSLDIGIYTFIFDLFIMVFLNENVLERSFGWKVIDTFAVLLLMYVIEPFLLHWFKTTPGKWILGITVQGRGGEKLTCEEARSRTFSVIIWGMGGSIPILSLIMLLKSYEAVKEGKTLDWEYDSELILEDKKKWRIVAHIAAWLIVCGLMIFSIFQTALPRHKGELTVEKFSDNYNRLATFYGIDDLGRLNDEGEWVVQDNGSTPLTDRSDDVPKLEYVVENGIIKSISFETIIENGKGLAPSYVDVRRVLILAYVFAKDECGILPIRDFNALFDIIHYPYEDYHKELYGVNISCDVEYTGYLPLGYELMYAETEEDTCYSIRFKMEDMQ